MIRRREPGPEVAALEIKLVSLRVLCVLLGHAVLLRAGKPYAELSGDLLGNVSLYSQQVSDLALILLAPELFVVAHVQQLCADGQTVATLHDSTCQHRAHTQLFPHRHRVRLLSCITKDGTTRAH